VTSGRPFGEAVGGNTFSFPFGSGISEVLKHQRVTGGFLFTVGKVYGARNWSLIICQKLLHLKFILCQKLLHLKLISGSELSEVWRQLLKCLVSINTNRKLLIKQPIEHKPYSEIWYWIILKA